MFFDWNNNGRKDDSFDNMMDFMMISEMEKDEKKAEGQHFGKEHRKLSVSADCTSGGFGSGDIPLI